MSTATTHATAGGGPSSARGRTVSALLDGGRLLRTSSRSASPMVRNLPPATNPRASQHQRDNIIASQSKLKARKIRLFRNGDAFFKVSE